MKRLLIAVIIAAACIVCADTANAQNWKKWQKTERQRYASMYERRRRADRFTVRQMHHERARVAVRLANGHIGSRFGYRALPPLPVYLPPPVVYAPCDRGNCRVDFRGYHHERYRHNPKHQDCRYYDDGKKYRHYDDEEE